jgi:integrase
MKIRKRKMKRRVVFQGDIFDATGARIRKSFRTRAEAEEWLAQQRIEAGKPQPVASAARNATIRAWWDEWEPQQTATIEASTLDSYRQLFTRHIAPALGALRVRDIHRGHIRALLAVKRQTLAANSVRLIRATLSVVHGDAVADGIISENPARVLAHERRKRPDHLSRCARRKHIRPLSKAHLAIFLDTAVRWCSPRDFTLFLALADAGLRPGEAVALQGEDFDPVTRSVHIERAAIAGAVNGTKTETSRDVDVTRRLAHALADLQARAEAEALMAGAMPGPWMFPTATGTLLDQHNVARLFRRVLQRAGLPKYRLYDLRHTFACHLLEDGAPLTYVAAQMGHASPTTTLQWYAAWIPSGDRSVIDRLEAGPLAVAVPEIPVGHPTSEEFVTGVTDEGFESDTPDGLEVPDSPAQLIGGPSRTRTLDPLIKSQLLYQLS